MIKSFTTDDAQALWRREHPRGVPPDIHRTALRKLTMLHAAVKLDDLRVPPGNRLEALKGNRVGQHGIRINDQWRFDTIDPIHPGEILDEEFLKPLGISQYRLAKEIGVPAVRINEIVHGKRGVTADTALRFAKFFRMTAEFWLNLQSHYDLEVQKDSMGDELRNIKPFQAAG